MGFDPAARRRVRRAAARARPLLLPAALLVAAVVVSSSLGAPEPATAGPAAPQVPAGLVLVAVQPADPAVLALATPGRRVDVYAATAPLDPLGTGPPGPAEVVVSEALVVPSGTGPPPGSGAGGLGLAGPPSTGPGALALLVEPAEAAALASRPGAALLVAVRGDPDQRDGPDQPDGLRRGGGVTAPRDVTRVPAGRAARRAVHARPSRRTAS